MTAAERDLDALLRGMRPCLVAGVHVFATLADNRIPDGAAPRMVFREAEGTTLILLRDTAQALGLAYQFPCRMITLQVHSSLQAVGFMARISAALAARGMGVNPVAGLFHDHLFVPDGRADEAMEVLAALSRAADRPG